MEAFLKYPELTTLERLPALLSVREVVATEKLHGSNFRVFFPAGVTSIEEVRFGGRNEIFAPGSDGFHGGRPVRWFRERPALLGRLAEVFAARGFGDVIVYGEVCGTSVQKGVRYAPDGEVFFRAFDVRVSGNFVTYDLFVELCEAAGLPRVPEIWRGEPSRAALDALLERPSDEASRNGVGAPANLAEGVVVRANPLLVDNLGTWLVIKHKAQKFREATMKVVREAPERGAVDAFVATYVVRGRVVNALGRLRDEGAALQESMSDMPLLCSAIVADLHKECGDEWHALEARGFDERLIRNGVSRALANVYRVLLAEAAL
jgi:Rnl2 family RNA ligase